MPKHTTPLSISLYLSLSVSVVLGGDWRTGRIGEEEKKKEEYERRRS
jgi:hypothetical protein